METSVEDRFVVENVLQFFDRVHIPDEIRLTGEAVRHKEGAMLEWSLNQNLDCSRSEMRVSDCGMINFRTDKWELIFYRQNVFLLWTTQHELHIQSNTFSWKFFGDNAPFRRHEL